MALERYPEELDMIAAFNQKRLDIIRQYDEERDLIRVAYDKRRISAEEFEIRFREIHNRQLKKIAGERAKLKRKTAKFSALRRQLLWGTD